MPINLLLTGAGGNLAYSIRRAVDLSELETRLVACDCNSNSVGLYLADTRYLVPRCDDTDYVNRIIQICIDEKIQAIFVGAMEEMAVLARLAALIKRETGAIVVSSNSASLEIMGDKRALTRHLQEHGFDAPRSVLPSGSKYEELAFKTFLSEVRFPYIVKNRWGAGSIDIGVAHHQRQLDYLIETIPNPVVQEYLSPDDQEYTVAVFLSREGKAAASITMHRELALGMTFKAEVLPNSPLNQYCKEVAETFGAVGPINLQLRVTERGPVIFEINPRFSSTTSARPQFGYNEATMALSHFVLGQPIEQPQITAGKLFRVIEDVVVGDDEQESSRPQVSKVVRANPDG